MLGHNTTVVARWGRQQEPLHATESSQLQTLLTNRTMLTFLIDWIFHLDTHLAALAANHGTLVYLVLFAIIFVETGIVVMPFLPGDSLLFVAGTLAAQHVLQLSVLIPALVIAAIAGDTVNYAVGRMVRRRTIDTGQLHFLKREHVARTDSFFKRHGAKTVVLARFVPIVRTLAPFVAALGRMELRTFLSYNILGAIAWVALLVGAGYSLGNLPFVSDNLNVVLLGIVLASLLPGVVSKATSRAGTKKRRNA